MKGFINQELDMRTEDGKIIERCLDGEPEVFGLLVDKYKASIYAVVYTRIHNFHDAQDITQEVFLEAYRACESSGIGIASCGGSTALPITTAKTGSRCNTTAQIPYSSKTRRNWRRYWNHLLLRHTTKTLRTNPFMIYWIHCRRNIARY